MTNQGSKIVLDLLRGRAEMVGRHLTDKAEELYMETLGPLGDTFAINVVKTALKESGMPDDEKLRSVARAIQGPSRVPERPKEDREAGLRAAKNFSEGFRRKWKQDHPDGKLIPDNLEAFLSGWFGRATQRASGEKVPYGKVEWNAKIRAAMEAEVYSHRKG